MFALLVFFFLFKTKFGKKKGGGRCLSFSLRLGYQGVGVALEKLGLTRHEVREEIVAGHRFAFRIDGQEFGLAQDLFYLELRPELNHNGSLFGELHVIVSVLLHEIPDLGRHRTAG